MKKKRSACSLAVYSLAGQKIHWLNNQMATLVKVVRCKFMKKGIFEKFGIKKKQPVVPPHRGDLCYYFEMIFPILFCPFTHR